MQRRHELVVVVLQGQPEPAGTHRDLRPRPAPREELLETRHAEPLPTPRTSMSGPQDAHKTGGPADGEVFAARPLPYRPAMGTSSGRSA